MPNSRESSLQAALTDLHQGKYTSLRACARAHRVPEATLRNRRAGRLPAPEAHSTQQRLSPEQEEELVRWILDEAGRGDPPTQGRIRLMAGRFARSAGDERPLGQNWVGNFVERQPRVKEVIVRSPRERVANVCVRERRGNAANDSGRMAVNNRDGTAASPAATGRRTTTGQSPGGLNPQAMRDFFATFRQLVEQFEVITRDMRDMAGTGVQA